MINQGIVTDSDTEKELKKWQQARATAVDEDKLKQQYKNRLNNAQGQHFEREILAGCRMYESHGIATIDKTPEPFRVTSKNHRTGEFTGRFSTHAQPDFQIWEKLEQEINTAAVASKKAENETTQGGLASAT